ncbi:GNAT family N-acetyltransferase [Psychrobacillus sp. FJAT-51614]|uniref:GNAT family N-acetyltransferase n=1 Tax=Psychrobacillus mangrovi TaxID=3117745 RepID=A0ABU8F8J0_9BACI
MKDSFTFVKDYKHNKLLRASFNNLASSTFGLNFETWFEHGYWSHKYIPYSFTNENKVIANASVNIIDVVIDNEIKKAVQIGTVMTDPTYRNQGLARMLMEIILEDYKDVDFFYLFANSNVLDFYPKFGFELHQETQYSMKFNGNSKNDSGVKQLSGQDKEDLTFIYHFSSKGKIVSNFFATKDTNELLMFYCMYVFPENIFYIPQEDLIILCEIKDNTLHIFDVISEQPYNLIELAKYVANENTNHIVLNFTPIGDTTEFTMTPYHDSNPLFVKLNHPNIRLPKHFKHPITSQA